MYYLVIKYHGCIPIVLGWTDNVYLMNHLLSDSNDRQSIEIKEYKCTRMQFENHLFIQYNIMEEDMHYFEFVLLYTHDNEPVITSQNIFHEVVYETGIVDSILRQGIESLCRLILMSRYIDDKHMYQFLIYVLRKYVYGIYRHMTNDQLSYAHFNDGVVDILKLVDQQGLFDI